MLLAWSWWTVWRVLLLSMRAMPLKSENWLWWSVTCIDGTLGYVVELAFVQFFNRKTAIAVLGFWLTCGCERCRNSFVMMLEIQESNIAWKWGSPEAVFILIVAMFDHPELYILRHGETIWNRQGRYQGRKDSPLTQKGRQQAVRQRKLLYTRSWMTACKNWI